MCLNKIISYFTIGLDVMTFSIEASKFLFCSEGATVVVLLEIEE